MQIANLSLEFTTLFLGHANFQTERSEEYLFGILISASRKVFTRHWLLPETPTIKEWIDIVNDIYNMEHIHSQTAEGKIYKVLA